MIDKNLSNPQEAASASAPARLIRLPAVLSMVGLGRSAWFDLVARGQAPRPIKIGRAALYVEAEIQAFITARVRQARGGL